jgi:hypothetical protein
VWRRLLVVNDDIATEPSAPAYKTKMLKEIVEKACFRNEETDNYCSLHSGKKVEFSKVMKGSFST